MTLKTLLLVIVLVTFMHVPVFAAGSVTIFGIVERVTFEPLKAPQRVRVYGAFAFLDNNSGKLGDVQKGYLYFQMPPGGVEARNAVGLQWLGLSGVAGTGRPVAFGSWGYSGAFSSEKLEYLLPEGKHGELAVQKDGATPAIPVVYFMNKLIMRLPDEEKLAAHVKQMRVALQR